MTYQKWLVIQLGTNPCQGCRSCELPGGLPPCCFAGTEAPHPGHSWDHCGWINKNAANLGNHEVWPVPFSYPGRFLGVLTHLSHLVTIKPREGSIAVVLSTGNSGSSKDAASEIPSHAVTCQRNSKHFQALWIGDSYDYCNRCSLPKKCLCRCIHIYNTNIYIYIYIERDRYTYIYVCVCMCIYIII